MLAHVVVIPLVLHPVGLIRHGAPAVPSQSILTALKDTVGIPQGKCKGKVAAPLSQDGVESPDKQRVALNLARRGVQEASRQSDSISSKHIIEPQNRDPVWKSRFQVPREQKIPAKS